MAAVITRRPWAPRARERDRARKSRSSPAAKYTKTPSIPSTAQVIIPKARCPPRPSHRLNRAPWYTPPVFWPPPKNL